MGGASGVWVPMYFLTIWVADSVNKMSQSDNNSASSSFQPCFSFHTNILKRFKKSSVKAWSHTHCFYRRLNTKGQTESTPCFFKLVAEKWRHENYKTSWKWKMSFDNPEWMRTSPFLNKYHHHLRFFFSVSRGEEHFLGIHIFIQYKCPSKTPANNVCPFWRYIKVKAFTLWA